MQNIDLSFNLTGLLTKNIKRNSEDYCSARMMQYQNSQTEKWREM